ncbi:hypothetical protein JS756_30930 [Streptomyces actuosus]|uniref:Uncharacterized protein n=1 Tax=Streptomyces actuosus TaxID=1885 RepID=A0ABS2VZN0_STRAS|nr:hypothetical protein [Streptomyces actuosus]MBN0048440.1 hypothetical protein [Streptomyces actuosus]
MHGASAHATAHNRVDLLGGLVAGAGFDVGGQGDVRPWLSYVRATRPRQRHGAGPAPQDERAAVPTAPRAPPPGRAGGVPARRRPDQPVAPVVDEAETGPVWRRDRRHP